MAKVRQDAWSHEDDLLLAETVLRHIREGGTQLNAFEEVGDELNRTSAACGFRWNAEVRNKYIQAIDLAKKQRKQKKRAQASNQRLTNEKHNMIEYAPISEETKEEHKLIMEPEPMDERMSLDIVIEYLETLSQDLYQSDHIKYKSDKLKTENSALLQKVTELEKELKLKEKRLATVEEDYQTFIEIMERARKMTVLDEPSKENSPAFRMDKNGNLEQVVQGHTN